MKNYAIALAVFLILAGCKDNPVSKKIQETRDAVTNTTSAVEEINKMQDDIQKLQDKEPLSNEELKAWLPDEVNGMKRISFKAGQAGMVNISSIEATYANDDKSKKFSINIVDGAGQMGAAATAGIRLVLSQEFEEEDENGSRKTVNKNGSKAIEEYRSDNNDSKIQLLESNRFYLEATGKNMDLDETWDAIDAIDLDQLG